MAETRTTSTQAVEKRTTPNDSDDLLRGVVEELAALRVIVEGTAHSTEERRGLRFHLTISAFRSSIWSLWRILHKDAVKPWQYEHTPR